jgi:CRP/FNR family transcriptional regulator
MKPPEVSCEVCGHRAESIFCSLAGAHLEQLDREKTVRRFEKGEVIFYEGTPAHAVHCIYTGRVKIYKTGPKGESIVIRLLGPGEIFGYRALLSDELCAATVEAVESTVICSITKPTLFGLLKQSPQLTMRLLAKMAQELRTSEEQLIAIAQETVRQRTAKLLLFLAEGNKHKYQPSTPLQIPLLRSEMAQMVGTAPETLSRTLRYLADRGMVQVNRAEILIINRKALKQLAGQ